MAKKWGGQSPLLLWACSITGQLLVLLQCVGVDWSLVKASQGEIGYSETQWDDRAVP